MNEENIIVSKQASKQASKQSRRLSWVDVLKGIGIILVVVGHVYLNRTVRDWLYSFHMPLFFLAAGWVYKEKPILTDIKSQTEPSFAIEVNKVSRTDRSMSATPAQRI